MWRARDEDSPRSWNISSCDDWPTDELAMRSKRTNYRCNETLRRRGASRNEQGFARASLTLDRSGQRLQDRLFRARVRNLTSTCCDGGSMHCMCMQHMPRTVLGRGESATEQVGASVQGIAPTFDHYEHERFPS